MLIWRDMFPQRKSCTRENDVVLELKSDINIVCKCKKLKFAYSSAEIKESE